MKNQMNSSNSPFHIHYWMVDDPAIAKELHISTEEKDVGDVYVFRKQSVYV